MGVGGGVLRVRSGLLMGRREGKGVKGRGTGCAVISQTFKF